MFPPPAVTGRPARSARTVLNAIFWVLHSGAPWRDLPERDGPWQSIYHRFNAWRKDGTIDKLLARIIHES
ncbi:transposase [bacterium]|nr:transposase [bacterium]MBU1072839.1 transposase [bacterium]MBU1675760.1 transposase [bacterium]